MHLQKLVLVLLFPLGMLAQNTNIANYRIQARLDVDKKIVHGKQVLQWTNTSKEMLHEVQFHMYLNAFKNENSTFMKESGGRLRNDRMDKKKRNWGNIFLQSFTTSKGENLLSSYTFIQTDDANSADQTVLEAKLKKPILPGETVEFQMDFRSQLPEIFARTGFAEGEFFMVAQWFPKIGVYEEAGMRGREKSGWNCHQFHGNTEFYSNFGRYEVDIIVPQNYVVGASGTLTKEEPLPERLKKLRFEAEKIHDFAWTASPKFVRKEEIYKGIKLIALLQPAHTSASHRYFNSVKTAIDYFEKIMGTYPHPTLTMVDPPLNASGASGMEYPRLITCGYLSYGMPSSIRLPEVVTVHEFGHQYFQGILANNEVEESWLDEGFNTYMEWRIMEELYPEGSQFSFLGLEVPGYASGRSSYVGMSNPEITEVGRYAYLYPKGTYGIMSYSKTGLWMRTLENLLGREIMDKILKAYFEQWRYRHPAAQDFIDIVNKIAPKELNFKHGDSYNWFFEQAVFKAYSCDYKIDSVSKSSIFIKREGKFIFPQNIEINYVDGDSEMVYWDGKASEKIVALKKELESVHLDKERHNLMDLNRLNNSYTSSSFSLFGLRFTAKWIFWSQRILYFFATWV